MADRLEGAELELEQLRTRLAAVEAELARYRDLFERAPEPYLVTDRAGTIRYANRAAERMLGVGGDRLLGKPIFAFVATTDRRSVRRLLLESERLAGGTTWEGALRREGAAAVDASVSLGSALDAEGESWGVSWLIRDVTERSRAEEAISRLAAELEKERARLEATVRQTPAGLVIAEGPSGRAVAANDEAARLIGGLDVDVDELEPLARALRIGEVVVAERIVLERQGVGRMIVEMSAAPTRDRSGAVTSAVAVLQDVSARERRERAEREFVTNAAHELQTPVAAITSAVEVLQSGAKEIPADRDRFLAHVERESARLTRLARALLVLAWAQTGQEDPRLERVPLAPLLDEVALGLEPTGNVEIDVRCGPRLAVLGDRDLVEQALANVAANAVKYTREGRIEIAARPLRFGKVAIEITDTGPGIPREDAENVFRRFFRSGVRGADGFGLGLAIARQAVDALGGEVHVEPRPRRGTTVRITLAAADARGREGRA